jgi:hypothetical protein
VLSSSCLLFTSTVVNMQGVGAVPRDWLGVLWPGSGWTASKLGYMADSKVCLGIDRDVSLDVR